MADSRVSHPTGRLSAIIAEFAGKGGFLPRGGVPLRPVFLLERLSLFALIVLIPFRLRAVFSANNYPGIYADFTDTLLHASDVLLLATLFFWAIRLLRSRPPFKWGPWFVSFPLVALTFMGLISGFFSVAPEISFYNSLRLIILFGFYLYCVNNITDFHALPLAIGLMVLVQSVVGIGQYLLQHSVGLYSFGELSLDATWEGVAIVWAPGQLAMRAYGLTDHPNILGGLLAIATLLMIPKAIESRSPWAILGYAVFVLGVLSLLVTFSRAAWLAFGTGWLFTAALFAREKPRTRLQKLIILSLAGLLVALPLLIQSSPYLGRRLSFPPGRLEPELSSLSPEDRSFAERDALNEAGGEIFSRHPLQGIGLAAFPIALYTEYPQFQFDFQPVHFLLLEVAAETGLFGALFYFLLISLPWLALLLTRRRLRFSSELIGATAALAACVMIGLFDYYLWLNTAGRLMQWLVWGVWAAEYQKSLMHE